MGTAGGANTPTSYAKEVTYGVPPTGTYQYLAQRDDKFVPGLSYETSQLLTTSAFPKDKILVDADGKGGFASEFVYGAHDDFLLAVIRAAAFSATHEITGVGLTVLAADQSFNDSGNGFTVANGYAVGKWVRAKGFPLATSNGLFKIVTRAAGKITVTGGSGGALVNDSGDADSKVKLGAQAVDGSTVPSFTFERQYKDKANLFAYSPGHLIQGFNFGLSPKQIVQVSVSTQGRPEVSATAARGSGFTAASTNPPMNSVTDLRAFLADYSVLAKVAEIGVDLQNELEPISVLGQLGAAEIAAHDASAKGNFRVLLPDTHTLADKALTNGESAFAVQFLDALGHYFLIDLPRVKFDSLDRANPGRKATIFLNMAYEAVIHPTEGVAVRLVKWDD